MFCHKCGNVITEKVYICPICEIKICGLCQKKGYCTDCYIDLNNCAFVFNYFSEKYKGVLLNEQQI